MDCWEFKKCGRERGGAKADELGVCPAYEHNAGKACWIVAGTFCGGKVQGAFAQKLIGCMQCDFFQRFSLKERSLAKKAFEHLAG